MMTRRPTAPTTLLAGIGRLMVFNPAGFAAFSATPQAFLSSLSPLIGFVIVGAALEIQGAGWRNGVADGLETLCVVLGQSVISHLIARMWKRDDRWLRYAAAMNWCHIAVPLVGVLFLTLVLTIGAIGPAPREMAYGAIGGIFIYTALLDWFLAWRGLDLSPMRAVALLCIVTGSLALLLAVPVMLRLAALGAAAAPAIST